MFELNICLATDKNYVKYMATTMVSILKNTMNEEFVIFHIIDGGISNNDKEKLLSLKNIKDFTIFFYTPDVKKYEEFFEKSKNKYHFTPAVFYRLCMASLIKNVDKVLYLDSDIIAIKNIRDIFNINIENYYAIVVDNSIELSFKEREEGYFCSGFLMANLKLWRETNIEDIFLYYYVNNYEECKMKDQDVLNKVLKGKVKYIDNFWSLLAHKVYIHDKIDVEKSITVHFLTGEKPWHRTSSSNKMYFINKYWEYYQYTPWFKDNITEAIDIMIDQKINLLNTKYNIFNSQYNNLDNRYNSLNEQYNDLDNKYKSLNEQYNNLDSKYNSLIYFYNNLLHHLSCWIPIRKLRDNFRVKFKIETRPDQTRPDQTRPDM